jgi:hypothetical protein
VESWVLVTRIVTVFLGSVEPQASADVLKRVAERPVAQVMHESGGECVLGLRWPEIVLAEMGLDHRLELARRVEYAD